MAENTEPKNEGLEDVPAWAKQLQESLSSLPDRIKEALTPDPEPEPDPQEPVVIPAPQPPEPEPKPQPEPVQDPEPEPKPKRKSLLDYLL